MVVWDFWTINSSLWLGFILYYPPRGRVHHISSHLGVIRKWSSTQMCRGSRGYVWICWFPGPRRVPALPIWSHKFWLLGWFGTGSNSLGLQTHKFPKVWRCDLVDSNLHVNKKESYQDGRKEVLLFMFFQHFSTTKFKEKFMMQRYDILYTWCQRKSYI